jgi:hypothetical protein
MSTRSIQCGACGARYKVPVSVQSKQVKCKACAAAIPLEPQSAGTAEVTAAARSPAARPGVKTITAPTSNRTGSLRERQSAKQPKPKSSPMKVVMIVACVAIAVFGWMISNP